MLFVKQCARLQQFAITFSLLLLLSCEQSNILASNEGIRIKVENSSGDNFAYGPSDSLSYFAPYPFNHTITNLNNKDYEIILLSKKVNRGTALNVIPVGLMTVRNPNRTQTEVIVAIPTNPQLGIVEIKDFFDFSVKHFYLKQMVEYWYSNRYGLNGSTIKGWEPIGLDDF